MDDDEETIILWAQCYIVCDPCKAIYAGGSVLANITFGFTSCPHCGCLASLETTMPIGEVTE